MRGVFTPSRIAVGLMGLVLGLVASTARAGTEVTLALDWIVNGTHAGYITALHHGWYAQEGLTVTIQRGFGSGDTVKRVGTRSATFGISDTGTLIASRSREAVPVTAVYMVYGQAALGILFRSDSGIRVPQDLAGRRIARSASGASVVMFPGFLAANGVERARIEEVVVDATAFLPLLLSRRVDAVLEQSLHLGRFRAAAVERGLTVQAMRFAEHGLVAYGNALVVHDETIATQPDLVRRFLRATDRGLRWAFAHKPEAIEIVRARHPEVQTEWGVEELEDTERLAWSPEALKHGLGWIDPAKMTATVDTVQRALALRSVVAVDEIYTTKLHPNATR